MCSLFRNLTAQPPAFHLQRLFAKFTEHSHLAIDRVVELYNAHNDLLRVSYFDERTGEDVSVDVRTEEYIQDQMDTRADTLTEQYQLAIILAELLYRAPLLHDLLAMCEQQDGEKSTLPIHEYTAQALKRSGGAADQAGVFEWLESYLRLIGMEIRDHQEEFGDESAMDAAKMRAWTEEIRYCQRFFILADH